MKLIHEIIPPFIPRKHSSACSDSRGCPSNLWMWYGVSRGNRAVVASKSDAWWVVEGQSQATHLGSEMRQGNHTGGVCWWTCVRQSRSPGSRPLVVCQLLWRKVRCQQEPRSTWCLGTGCHLQKRGTRWIPEIWDGSWKSLYEMGEVMSGGSKEGMAPYPKATTVLLKTLLEEAMRRQISSSLTSSPCRHLFLMQTQHKPLPK